MPLQIIDPDWIQQHVYLIRGQKVMLSHDLALLYQVEPKILMQAVKRNLDRFPSDFMFHLENQEFTNLKSQIVTSSWGGLRKLPYAFTEHGIAMLSSVLKSQRAIQVNIEIMRAFVGFRKFLTTHKELSDKLNTIEKRYDQQFQVVFDAIREIISPPETKRRKIGFYSDSED